MFLKTQDIVCMVLMLQTTTLSAQQRLAEYPRGCYQRMRHIQALFEGDHGTAPDLIYVRGVPDTPDPGHTNFDKKTCTLILIEDGFSRDLGCDKKHTVKTEKYSPLVAALR